MCWAAGRRSSGARSRPSSLASMLNTVLLDGFLPACGPADLPARGRRTGLTEIGLPYAADAAITRHLARFLGQQAGSLHSGGQLVLPSAVLFNGGVFKAQELRRRVLDVLSSWSGRPSPRARVIRPGPGSRPWCRLLRPGAPRQGRADSRRGFAVVLRRPGNGRAGGPWHSAADQGALCRSDGHGGRNRDGRSRPRDRPDRRRAGAVSFSGLDRSPRRFPGHDPRALERRTSSKSSLRWKPPLKPPTCSAGEPVPVRLHSRVNEVGTLELSCQSTRDQRRWKLEYSVRESTDG